ncbi:MAG: carbamoyltransferase HypF, partial [Acidimicrobiales bacterium]
VGGGGVGGGVGAPLTSSAGRLFDAVAAICSVRDRVNYEGQAAVELEQRVDRDETGAYLVSTVAGTPLQLRGTDLVRGVVEDVMAGADVGAVAARFHNGLAGAVVEACEAVADRTGLTSVALSGGVFQNLVLLDRVGAGLRRAGMRVLTHSRVPPNDGGISLGQVAVAGALAAHRHGHG